MKSFSGFVDSNEIKNISTDEYILKIRFLDKEATRAIVKCFVDETLNARGMRSEGFALKN